MADMAEKSADKGESETLDSPNTPMSPQPHNTYKNVSAAVYVCVWIFFSSSVILFNKWILTNGFPYPIALTTWHLTFASVVTQILLRTTSLLDGVHKVPMTKQLYIRAVFPIGVFFSASLICYNIAYLYLSVSFIQMLKATTPVVVLLSSWLTGLERPNLAVLVNITGIVLGIVMASYGELQFDWFGFTVQVSGILFESGRLVLVQRLLSAPEYKMDPLVSLHYYAPVCAVLNFICCMIFERDSFSWAAVQNLGYPIFFLNASVALLLNVSVVFLIGKTSSLVLTLSGVLKDIILICISVFVWKSEISALQIVGYSIALAGLVQYKLGSSYLKEALSGRMDEARVGIGSKKVIKSVVLSVIVLASFLSVALLFKVNPTPQGRTDVIEQTNPHVGVHDFYQPESKLDIVFSYFGEDYKKLRERIDELVALPNVAMRKPRIRVYTKRQDANIGQIRARLMADQVTTLPNKDKEGDTFLHHILQNWDNLAQHTIFLQGDMHRFEYMMSRIERRFTDNTGVLSLGMTYGVCDCRKCQDPWGGSDVWYRVPEIYTMAHQSLCPPEGILLGYTGQNVVSAKRIRGTSKKVYQHLLSVIESPPEHFIHRDIEKFQPDRFKDTDVDPFFGHTLERSWMTLFRCNDVTLARDCPSLENDKSAQGTCQCLD